MTLRLRIAIDELLHIGPRSGAQLGSGSPLRTELAAPTVPKAEFLPALYTLAASPYDVRSMPMSQPIGADPSSGPTHSPRGSGARDEILSASNETGVAQPCPF